MLDLSLLKNGLKMNVMSYPLDRFNDGTQGQFFGGGMDQLIKIFGNRVG